VLLVWPHPLSDWKDSLELVEAVYLAIAREIVRQESLLVVCRDEPHRYHITDLLQRAGTMRDAVRLYIAPSNDTWARDYGPVAVSGVSGTLLLDFGFNGWGNRYPSELDNAITHTLYKAGAFGTVDYRRLPFILEGGSIDTDGRGTLLATTRCLIASGRNPGYDRQRLEHLFNELTGIDRVLWLDHGLLAGDDTDGHVDMLARFCSEDTIAYTRCEDPHDSHYRELDAMARQLGSFLNHEGQPYRLIPLPLPKAIIDGTGRRLPASYSNFLIINGAVLVPVYADPADTVALRRLATGFPGRRMVPIDCRALIRQFGSLHCATMQLPEGAL
jgi:agmatine/peptidylarginine deiminase